MRTESSAGRDHHRRHRRDVPRLVCVLLVGLRALLLIARAPHAALGLALLVQIVVRQGRGERKRLY